MCVRVFFTSTIPSYTLYMVANPVRGLLDRKISEEHLQSSNESMKIKQKRQKERNNNTKHMPENDRRGALDGESWVFHQPRAIQYPTGWLLSRICTEKHSIYNSALSGFQFSLSAQSSNQRLRSPWVGLINAALKRLKLATVTPSATLTLSASTASLFLCRCSDAFSSSFTHAAINLKPSSCTVLCYTMYHTPGSSAVML